MATAVRQSESTPPQAMPDSGNSTRECQKVLIPLDGSQAGESILPMVEQMAAAEPTKRTEAILLHVITPTIFAGSDLMLVSGQYVDDQVRAAAKQAEHYLHLIAEELRLRGIAASVAVEIGNPTERIIAVAHQSNVNLIAMATRGRSGLGRFFLGSVTDSVVRSVNLPVLTVKVKPQA